MTTIERVDPGTGQQGEIAVSIVDTDVHPLPVSVDVLKSYAPADWVDKIWPTGNAVSPVPHFYDTPDSYKTMSLRMDAAPPNGGVAGATRTTPRSSCWWTPASASRRWSRCATPSCRRPNTC